MDVNTCSVAVDRHRDAILEAERYLWRHPATGFREWEASDYLADRFEAAGYILTRAGDIPGFYTDLDTGRPGPTVLVMAELDALTAPTHPEAVNGCAHACGHHAQCAALLGLALALKEPGTLDGLCGVIRLMAVPAEELIELEYRRSLREQGIIHYLSGKTEFLYRGYMDGVDIAFMVHTNTRTDCLFCCADGANGFIVKDAVFEGVACHAAEPSKGVNALNALSLGLQGINALREIFLDEDRVRVHPIVTDGGSTINIIPGQAVLSAYVRGNALENIIENNRRVTRVLAAGALAVGGNIRITDMLGYMPLHTDPHLRQIAAECSAALVGEDKTDFSHWWNSGSSDIGDISSLIPCVHPYVAGATGRGHGDDFRVDRPEIACVLSAQMQLLMLRTLLSNDAIRARQVIAEHHPLFADKEAYFRTVDQMWVKDRRLIEYRDDGAAVIAG